MKEVFILYSADAWISRSSMVCMGVFSSLGKAIEGAMGELSKTLDEDELDECYKDLLNYRQTHGLDENWHIEIVELDKFGEV